jgi:hypothetical protein
MLRPLVFAPIVAGRNARPATSSACPTIVDVVGNLLTDFRRLKQVLPGGGIASRLREHSILRRLISQIVGVLHLTAPGWNLPSVCTPARFRFGCGQIEVDLHLGVSEPSQWNVTFLAACIWIILRQLDFLHTFNPIDGSHMSAVGTHDLHVLRDVLRDHSRRRHESLLGTGPPQDLFSLKGRQLASLFRNFAVCLLSSLNYVFCFSFLWLFRSSLWRFHFHFLCCWFHSSVLFGHRAQRVHAAKHECAGGAKVGPCLTDAAPKAAPGALSVKVSRYAKVRTSTSAVAAACCFGGVINTSLQQMSLQHSMGRSASIQAGDMMIIPLMLNVKNCGDVGTINHTT